MVGKGYLKPDISNARSDTPKSFKRIIQDCIKYVREERPPFQQVCKRNKDNECIKNKNSFFNVSSTDSTRPTLIIGTPLMNEVQQRHKCSVTNEDGNFSEI